MNEQRRQTLWPDINDEQWNDWHWQMSNRITNHKELLQAMSVPSEEADQIEKCLENFRMAITPYYFSLMDPQNPECSIRKQAIPSIHELSKSSCDLEDPLHEEADSPVPGLTHRYPDRVLLLVTDQCSMYCRHCTRRRMAGQTDKALPLNQFKLALDYIRSNPQIRDVLISGGDPLTLSDDRLDYILSNLRSIPNVEIIRIGTRTPVVLPMRITDKLIEVFQKYHPIWINTHFNHPKELTIEARNALNKLANAGIPLGNQTVLLRGINDCPVIMKKLVHELVKCRVRPYYLYQCDLSSGIEHFRTSVSTGLEIIEMLRGHTSGFAVPVFVVDAPGGGGKIPLQPNYLISQSNDKVILRNYEGVISVYQEPEDKTSRCKTCANTCSSSKTRKIGLAKLLKGGLISLTPQENMRQERRKKVSGGCGGGANV
ncbi:lysine 2,3-aminomutase [Desulfosporosinus nitroreducens]|uniref:L-lysine 2,3-aminomutase n=1 Tax=Desulfosporosinus nitroreducens TaxID=2018668 RepID=A0ABT8QTW6_9FIRM|nr:lysine 2,3-aminomutase [Desulfosporosinus nitroreducens]MCO1601743.1 lysine 2,3-aminomutase [Desulfosporosinus nitroreducens]MDO0824812.1 lysine 2,3-aminomutase [Desulfosporosinus nitroreducens]